MKLWVPHPCDVFVFCRKGWIAQTFSMSFVLLWLNFLFFLSSWSARGGMIAYKSEKQVPFGYAQRQAFDSAEVRFAPCEQSGWVKERTERQKQVLRLR